MKRLLLLFVPAALILLAGLAVWLLWAGPGPANAPKTIIVAQGSSLARVADHQVVLVKAVEGLGQFVEVGADMVGHEFGHCSVDRLVVL